ncbi:MAG: sugar transferase [Terriglobales bacterium]
MGELTTNRLWDGGPHDLPSPYARMIPGVATTGRFRAGLSTPTPTATVAASPSANVTGKTAMRRKAKPMSIEQLLPHPIADRCVLFQRVAADLLVLGIACCASSLVSSAWGLRWFNIPIFAVLVTLFGFSEGLYQYAGDPYPAGVVAILMRSTLFAAALVFVSAWDGMRPLAALTIFASSLVGLVLWRKLRHFAWERRRCESESRRILIVGGGAVARSLASVLQKDPAHSTTVCGFVDDTLPLSPRVLGRVADLDWLARAQFIDEVILAVPGQPALVREAAEVAYRNRLDIRAVPDLPPGPWLDGNVERIGEIPIVTLHREALPGAALLLKRLLDVVGAALGLVLASPLMAIVALLIRLDSPGPVVYSAERTGAKGCRFRCFKFRSMVTNAEHLKEELLHRNQRQGPIFKIDNDPRITRIGRWIRRYSLDELPQLWNVLRGEMSLVGPRPHPVDEVNRYELQHYRRLDVKPGITGLWQITARGCPSFELNMHLDLTYIETWTLRLDLLILARTLRVLFVPEGA